MGVVWGNVPGEVETLGLVRRVSALNGNRHMEQQEFQRESGGDEDLLLRSGNWQHCRTGSRRMMPVVLEWKGVRRTTWAGCFHWLRWMPIKCIPAFRDVVYRFMTTKDSVGHTIYRNEEERRSLMKSFKWCIVTRKLECYRESVDWYVVSAPNGGFNGTAVKLLARGKCKPSL